MDSSASINHRSKHNNNELRPAQLVTSKTDIETAQNAKIPVVAVDFGYTELPVDAYEPDRVISHFDELWDAVEALIKAA